VTTISPVEVTYEYTASIVYGGGSDALDVDSITFSADQDRVNWAVATVTLAACDAIQWAALDPRIAPGGTAGQQVAFSVTQKTTAGVTIASLAASLYVRSVSRDYMGGPVTIQLAGPESMMQDKLLLYPVTGFDTGAATVYDLVIYALLEVFGSYSLNSEAIVQDTTIDSFERRLHNCGESFIDVLKPELDAINCRLYSEWGTSWHVGARNAQTGRTVRLAAYTQPEGAPEDADPIVYSVVENVSRDGDWADGVVTKYDTTSTLGAGGTVSFNRYPQPGQNTKGLMLTFDRANPGGEPAKGIQSRTVTRGYDLTITARARLDIDPGDAVEVVLRDRVLTGNIRAIEWSFPSGGELTMTIRAQSSEPL
jgi:hypothetical protein